MSFAAAASASDIINSFIGMSLAAVVAVCVCAMNSEFPGVLIRFAI
jgi:hypothetical protein